VIYSIHSTLNFICVPIKFDGSHHKVELLADESGALSPYGNLTMFIILVNSQP
jgi:hypothetical protein